MNIESTCFFPNRREFLRNIIRAGTFVCLGGSNLLALAQSQEKPKVKSKKHKFSEDAGQSWEWIFYFAFIGFYIPAMQSIADEIGRDRLIDILKRSHSKRIAQEVEKNRNKLDQKVFEDFKARHKKNITTTSFLTHVLTAELGEESENIYEVKYTECLFAKIFRHTKASDIGYAGVCHGDFASTSAESPKLKLVRTKTLMQGDECCDFRFVWEG